MRPRAQQVRLLPAANGLAIFSTYSERWAVIRPALFFAVHAS